jgi:phosphoribosylaminoimidazole-succinocarboxamide synthase
MRYKDTATAFNGEKKEDLEGKGGLNAEISRIIFAYLEQGGVETHLIKVIDDTSELIKKAEIVMVEVIVDRKSTRLNSSHI